jgi:hypothetical protein
MSGQHEEDGLHPRPRVRGDHESDGRIEPASKLGLTDEGRRVLAALKALDLLPPHPAGEDGEPGSEPAG